MDDELPGAWTGFDDAPIRLRLTLRVGGYHRDDGFGGNLGNRGLDLVVTAPAGSTVARLRSALGAAFPELAAGRRRLPSVPGLEAPEPGLPVLSVQGRTLQDELLVGAPPLVQGVVIAATAARTRPGRGAGPASRPDVDAAGSGGSGPRGHTAEPGGAQPGEAQPGGTGRPEREAQASLVPDGRGHLLVNRAPRLDRLSATPEPASVTVPAQPPAAVPAVVAAGAPWTGILVPLALSGLAALLWHQPVLLALAAASALAALGQHLAERRGRRQAHRQAGRETERAAAAARQALAAGLARQADELRRTYPDPAGVARCIAGTDRRLWQRRTADPDGLVVRLGLGTVPATVSVPGPDPCPVPLLEEVPVTVDLRRTRVFGIAGPREQVLGLARSLIGQLVAWHSPSELRLTVRSARSSGAAEWAWVWWLPHAGHPDCEHDPEESGHPLTDRPSDVSVHSAHRFDVLVLDGAERLRRQPDLARALAGAGTPAGRQLLVCLDELAAQLPIECDGTLSLRAGQGIVHVRGEPSRPVQVDRAGSDWALGLARALAPLRDPIPVTDHPGLPDEVDLRRLLIRVLGVDLLDPDQLTRAWSRHGQRRPLAVLGVHESGPWQVDLGRDGPHLLVAGTTGAGKSELLRTLVAALAATVPPDELAVLLLDYKGGNSLAELTGLPHVCGLVTDLDPRLAARALASLHAELRRRERLLGEAGAVDLNGYLQRRARARPGSLPALARLVIVVDEYRVLAEELPELLGGLLRVATVGRSLGVHLVLATQRPGGTVTADLRANVNLRIALRLRDRADSEDVVEAPDAALLPAAVPGRAVARGGGGPLLLIQVARLVEPQTAPECPATLTPAGDRGPRPGTHPFTLHRAELDPAAAGIRRLVPVPAGTATTAAGGPATVGPATVGPATVGPATVGPATVGPATVGLAPDSAPSATGDGAAASFVAAATEAARRLGVSPPPAPWLPPLPELVTFAQLTASSPDEPHRSRGSPSDGAPFATVPIALADRPDRQCREALGWDLRAGGHLAVIGGPGSGRTTTLHSLAVAAAVRGVHVHALDAGSGLAADSGLAVLDAPELRLRLPTIGTVLPVHDLERAARLLHLLEGRLASRDAEAHPPMLLLVDGWESLLDVWGQPDHGHLLDDLLRLARHGGGTGLRLALSGGRALLGGTVSGLLTQRLILRTADPTDLLLAGVPAAHQHPPAPLPGRGLWLAGGDVLEVQVAVLGADRHPAAQARALAELTGSGRPETGRWGAAPSPVSPLHQAPVAAGAAPAGSPPLRLAPLPRRLTLSTLRRRCLAPAPVSAVSSPVPAPGPGAGTALLHAAAACCAEAPPRRALIPIGLGGDELAPLGLDPGSFPGALILGAPGSGRSTTLLTLGRQLLVAGYRVVVLANTHSPASRLTGPGVTLLDARPDPAALARALDGSREPQPQRVPPPQAVLIDDAAWLAGTAVEELLLALLAPAQVTPPGPSFVVAAATPGETLASYRGVLPEFRRLRHGVLLGALGPGERDLLGTPAPAGCGHGGPPGRGLLVTGGRVLPIQIAEPDRESPEPGAESVAEPL